MQDVLSRAKPRHQQGVGTGETPQWQAFQGDPQPQLPALQQTPRARAIREVNRIALQYGWASEVSKFLDQCHCSTVSRLEDKDLQQLLERMRQLQDCRQYIVGSPDAPPAT